MKYEFFLDGRLHRSGDIGPGQVPAWIRRETSADDAEEYHAANQPATVRLFTLWHGFDPSEIEVYELREETP